MNLEFIGEMWFWKGPSPWHFLTVPEEECGELEAASAFVSYGWGMIPVTAQIGETGWKTSLFPKDGRYIVPGEGVGPEGRRARGRRHDDRPPSRRRLSTRRTSDFAIRGMTGRSR